MSSVKKSTSQPVAKTLPDVDTVRTSRLSEIAREPPERAACYSQQPTRCNVPLLLYSVALPVLSATPRTPRCQATHAGIAGMDYYLWQVPTLDSQSSQPLEGVYFADLADA